MKEEPRDDAEVERKEEAGIDQAFAEASSSSEDEELTEHGAFLAWKVEEKHGCRLCVVRSILQARS